MTRRSQQYPRELRERAVRMAAEVTSNYDSQWAAIGAVAQKLGVGSAETVRKWVRQAEVDNGQRAGTTTEDSAEIKRLKREVAELRRANEILKAASAFFASVPSSTGRSRAREVHRTARRLPRRWAALGEPICAVLSEHGCPIAPSTYYGARTSTGQPSRRELREQELKVEIARVHAENYGVYGARKVRLQLNREGIPVARCTVERLMRQLGLAGARRGRRHRTTVADDAAARPADLVGRQFNPPAPNRTWVADFTSSRPGPGWSTSPSSSTLTPAASWAGAPRRACAPRSCWTRPSRRCGPAPATASASCPG
jgi:putative transposase